MHPDQGPGRKALSDPHPRLALRPIMPVSRQTVILYVRHFRCGDSDCLKTTVADARGLGRIVRETSTPHHLSAPPHPTHTVICLNLPLHITLNETAGVVKALRIIESRGKLAYA